MDFGLLHYIGPLAPPFKRSILDMAHDNAHAIALDYIYPGCPLWEFNRAKVVAAASWLLEQTEKDGFRTTMMIDKLRGVLIGFALHFSEPDNPTMGRICFGIVQDSFRGQRVCRRILQSLDREYEGLMIHCRPEGLERGRAMGFQVVGTQRSAILMATKAGTYPKSPIPANLYLESEQVRDENRKVRERLGTTGARQEFRAYIRKQCQEERRAKRIFDENQTTVTH